MADVVFRQDIASILECPLCMRLMHEPITVPCGHSFCRACLRRALEHMRAQCPTCRAPCHVDAFHAATTILLNKIIAAGFAVEARERAEEAKADEAEVAATRLGLFFLPYSIFPGTTVRLHVYEPRYLTLLGRCMESNAPFGICDGPTATHGIMLRIESAERLPHGRLLVLSLATSRFRIAPQAGSAPEAEANSGGLHYAIVEQYDDIELSTDILARESYEAELALVTPGSAAALVDIPQTAAALMLRDALASALLRIVGSLGHGAQEDLRRVSPPLPAPTATPRTWSLYATAVLSLSPAAKQAALASTDTLRRLLLAYSHLERLEIQVRPDAVSGNPGLTPITTVAAMQCLEAFVPPLRVSIGGLRDGLLAMARTPHGRSLLILLAVVLLLFLLKNDPVQSHRFGQHV